MAHENSGYSRGAMIRRMLAAAAAGCVLSWACFKPSDTERRAIEDYDRVRSVGYKHEACLKELADHYSDPDSLREAKADISRTRSRANDCFRGNW